MNCEKIIRTYLKGEGKKSIKVLIHTCMCRKCAVEIALLDKSYDCFGNAYPFKAPDSLEESVMTSIRLSGKNHAKSISGTIWSAVGVMIFASIFLITYSNEFNLIESVFGDIFIIPVSIVLGVVLTAYASLYIGSNLGKITKYFHIKER